MKKFFKTATIFFLISVFSFSLLANSVFAVDGDLSGASAGVTAKTPWQQIADKCPISEIFSSGDKAGLCLSGYGAAIGLWSYEAVGEVLEGVETALNDTLKIFDLSVTGIFARIVVLISQIVGFIVAQEMYLMVFFMSPDTFQYATFPAVQAGFYVALQIANGLLALGLVILANKFILGMESYSNLQSLTRYLVTALLINFSLVMASYIVGVSNFLTIAFLNQATAPITGGTTENYATRLMATMNQLSEVFSGLVTIDGDLVQTTVANITTILVLIIFSLFLMMILAAIIVSLLTRVIALWTLMMVVPLAIAADTVFSGMKIPGIPVGSGNFDKWLGSFIKWVSFGPIMAGVIWFVFLVLGQAPFAFAQAWANDPNIGIIMATLGKTFTLLIAMMLLYQGYVFAHSSSSGVPKFVDGAVRNIFSYGEKGLQFTGKGSLTKFGMGLANSKPGRDLQVALANVPLLSRLSRGLGKLGAEATKMKGEDATKVSSHFSRMYSMARTDKEREAVLTAAMTSGSPTFGSVLGSLGGSLDPAKHAGALEFLSGNDDGREELVKKLAEGVKNSKDVEAKVAKVNNFATAQGVKVKLDADDIYKLKPNLVEEDKKERFVNKLSAEDLAKLEGDVLGDVLKHINSPKTLRDTVEKVASDSEKSQKVFEALDKRVRGSEALAKDWSKDAGMNVWLEKMGKLSDKMDERMKAGEKVTKEQLAAASKISSQAKDLHGYIRGKGGGGGTPGGTVGTPIT